MRNIIAAIGAIMRAFGSFTTRMVRRGGKWIAELIRVPGDPVPAAPTVPTISQPADDYGNVKRVAGMIAAGLDPAPADLKSITPLTAKWLAALDRPNLLKIAAATPDAIRDHMKNRQRLRGVVPFEKEAIDDVTNDVMTKPLPSVRYNTLRDQLEADLGVSLAA